MTRAPRIFHTLITLVAASALVAGCGGAPAADAGSATPDASASGSTVAAQGDATATGTTPADGTAAPAAGAVDPATGLSAVADPSGLSVTATIPSLNGDDISGGIGAMSATDVFAPAGLDSQAASALLTPKTETTPTAPTGSTTTATQEAVTYTGAVIYVNSKTYTVAKNGTFPAGKPVFRLISVASDSIEIALIAGEFTGDGGDGLFLDKGDLVKLLDQSENITYKTKFLRPLVDASQQGF
ncbi:MAG: hypothetical protein H7287_14580 [Thermoleophilia bacterium]|nr:hypothetical protein [Thermoleophilia bacterium]